MELSPLYDILCFVIRAALLAEVRAELLFLLIGQVGLNDLELLAFDGISHLV